MKWASKMEALIEKVIRLAVMLASLDIKGFVDGKALGWLDECDVGQLYLDGLLEGWLLFAVLVEVVGDKVG